MSDIKWIAIDWGTSSLRAWAISGDEEIIDHRENACGMARVSRDQFETVLLSLIEDWLPTEGTIPVVACGMVGAKQGWQEAPYQMVPAHLKAELTPVKCVDSRISMYICAGMKQMEPADVMRGEESQLIGLVYEMPDFEGVVCLPGTHSKWALVANERLERFQTFMTGELFSLLAKQSVLRFSIDLDEWQEARFDEGVLQAVDAPGDISAKLFSLRANDLVSEHAVLGNAALLSGYLIGLELAAAREYWHSADVYIIGANKLAMNYHRALALLGKNAHLLDAQQLTLAGLRSAYQQTE